MSLLIGYSVLLLSRTGLIVGPDTPQRIVNLFLAFENQPTARHAKTQVLLRNL
jgi:hypothetical protein